MTTSAEITIKQTEVSQRGLVVVTRAIRIF
jgi:hypothetical protein